MELIARAARSAVAVPNLADEILQNAINSFRTALTPEQLAEFNSIQSVPDTDAVLVFTAELDLRRQSQKGKSIASRLFPVLQAVHSFIGVIDTYVSSNPTIAALVWGSVKITIQIMLNAASYYEAFAELFMNLGTVCPRFDQYQALFPTSTRLQEALCNFNASIIRCCQRVIQMPKGSSGWTSPLNPLNPTFWQSFQQSFEPNLKELRDNSKNVEKEIRLAQAESDHRNRELQKLENGEAEKSRRSMGHFMSRTETRFDKMHQSQLARDVEMERERRQRLLDSLSTHDYMKPLKQARQKRYPQSAGWIFGTHEFKRWAAAETSPLLWCSGKMGSGKTILAASVIDFLLTERSQHKRTVTFFFSRFDDPESLRAEVILRAVARQMVNVEDISSDTKVALEETQNANGDVLKRVTQLLGFLLTQKRQPTWIVIDGIDEWPRDERHELIEALSSILAAGSAIKLFATSRDYPDSITQKAFPSLHRMSMNCSEAQRGMAQLVDQAVQKCLDAEELLVKDKELIADIKKTLTQNADGMILWVTLVLRDLCVQPNNEKIRDAISLKNLPKSLADVFNRALVRIISEGKEETIQAILPWIVAAKQPLSLSQLQECCLIRVLQKYSIEDRYLNGIHLIDCWFQGLVEVDYETKTVHFIHSSVQKFFLTAPIKSAFNDFYINMDEADRYIGEIVVTYLNFNDFKNTLTRQRQALPPISPEEICQQALSNEFGWRNFLLRGRGARTADIDGTIAACTPASGIAFHETMVFHHPFLSYATAHWLSHSAKFDHQQCLVWHLWTSMVINGHLLAASPVSEEHHQAIDEVLINWAMSTEHSALLHIVITFKTLFAQFRTAMFEYAIDKKDVELLSHMLETDIEGSELSGWCCRAAHCGHVEIMKVFVNAGVDLDGGNGRPEKRPLMEAIKAGQFETMEYLLGEGINPDLPTRSYRNALEQAVDLGGYKGVQACEILIRAGTHIDDTELSGYSMTALQRACRTSQEEVTNLLLRAGANPDTSHIPPFGSGVTPLGLSIQNRDIKIINLLLASGADVNRRPSGGFTPLRTACSLMHPRLDIVELLINAGADMNEEQSFELLKMAVRRKCGDLVKLLIREGATVKRYVGRVDDTPLAIAAREGLFEIMHILLDGGVQVVYSQPILELIPRELQNGEEYKRISKRLCESSR
ncbi:uncharacterized protein FIESC28_09311 [Fusarium coffeatum]|uniref:Uncharacterized protein n=1 Tax=Fusarium coffeatum TaxID=231269 RepID=A0A366R3C7_9HYPO|nr:uncharacterized protein FIESC28_09311 [Fusarium coffeatum]RBR10780.1 hypothetical protein FIESC28_09311 [Fusarium coffeatum]